jgi:16S rRNA (guanine527-N7)-methyltransferase
MAPMSLDLELSTLELSPSLAPRLEQYIQLLQIWNQSINLSGGKTPRELTEHVEDCLHVVRHLTSAKKVLDVGSGAGLPGIIIAICNSAIKVTALEPTGKRVAFLRTAVRELGLSNFVVHQQRLEEHDHFEYDAAISRATFPLEAWLELGSKYVRPGGAVLGMEGREQIALPANASRHAYSIQGKVRALLVLPVGPPLVPLS